MHNVWRALAIALVLSVVLGSSALAAPKRCHPVRGCPTPTVTVTPTATPTETPMGIVQTKVITTAVGGGENDLVGSFDSLPAIGNHVIVLANMHGIEQSDPGGWTITDNQGHTYLNAFQFAGENDSAGFRYTKVSGSSGTFTVTFTSPGWPFTGSCAYLVLIEVAGLADSPLDRSSGGSALNDSPDTGATATTVWPTELVLAHAYGEFGTTFMNADSFVEIDQAATAGDWATIAYKEVSATGAQQETWTSDTDQWTAILTTWKYVQAIRPDGTNAAGNWTAHPSGSLHANTADDSDTTSASLADGADPSTMILDLETLEEPEAGDGYLLVRARRID